MQRTMFAAGGGLNTADDWRNYSGEEFNGLYGLAKSYIPIIPGEEDGPQSNEGRSVVIEPYVIVLKADEVGHDETGAVSAVDTNGLPRFPALRLDKALELLQLTGGFPPPRSAHAGLAMGDPPDLSVLNGLAPDSTWVVIGWRPTETAVDGGRLIDGTAGIDLDLPLWEYRRRTAAS